MAKPSPQRNPSFVLPENFKDEILNTSQDLICIAGMDGYFKYLNPAWEAILGYTIDELMARPFLEFIHPDDHGRINREVAHLAAGNRSVDFENRFVCRDGSMRYISWRATPLLDKQLMFCIGRDLSERKRTEKALLVSEARYRELFNGMHNGVAVYEISDNGHSVIIKDVNPAAEKIDKIKKKDIIGKPAVRIFPAIQEFGLLDVFKRVWMTGIPERHPIKFYRDDRISGWRENLVYRLPTGEIVAVYQDLSDIKKAEIELNQTVRFYEDIIENVQDGIWVSDRQDVVFYLNKGMEIIAGVSKKSIVGKSVFHDFDFETTGEFLKYYREARERLKPVWYEVPVQTPAGKNTWQNGWLVPRIRGHEFDGMICTIRDITLRKEAEDTLKQNEEKYRMLFMNMLNGFALHKIVVDDNNNPVDYIFLEVNAAFEAMAGLKQKDILNKRVSEVLPGIQDDPADWIGKYGEVALHEKPLHFEAYSAPLKRWYMVNAFSMENGCFATVIQDITGMKKAELQIKRDLKEKDVLLRELYHRTKNNMQLITSILRLKARAVQSDELQLIFRDIENKIRSMALVHQKLYESGDLYSLDLKSYLEDLINYIRDSFFPDRERIRLNFSGDEATVRIDTAIPLGLVINELLSNAVKYAFPNGRKGEIHIRQKVLSGNRIQLKIVDDGVGVSPDFDPEKDASLGLKTIIDLVENQLNGKIEFQLSDGFCCQILLQG